MSTIFPAEKTSRYIHRGTIRIAAFCWVFLSAVSSQAAGPVYWDWPESRSFQELRLDGAALDRNGHLVAGLPAMAIGPKSSDVYWCLASDSDGGFFTGAGHDGTVYHTDSRGQTEIFAALGASEVLSLVFDPEVGLYAGTGPEGKLFHIDSEGQVKLLGTVDGGYIWSLATGGDTGEVWMGCGTPAALYRYIPEEGLSRFAVLPATNALDVIRADSGDVFLATQGPGLVYRFDPDRPDTPDLLFETPQDEVRQLVRGPAGELFVFALNSTDKMDPDGLASGGIGAGGPPTPLMMLLNGKEESQVPRASLWRIAADGTVFPVWSGDEDLMVTAWSSEAGWLAGGPLQKESGQSQLLRLTPPAGSYPVAGWSGGDILDILVAGPGPILVSQGHPQMVVALGETVPGERLAVSPALDAKRPVHWGRLRWTAVGKSDGLEWSVRGGNRSVPDESWSDWSDSWKDADHEIKLSPSRFLQWRVKIPASSKGEAARVSAVSVSAWLENSAPVIRHLTQERLQGIESGGLVSHSDNLTQVFRSGLKVEFDRQTKARDAVSPRGAQASRAVRVFSWVGADPDEDRLTYRLEYRAQQKGNWRQVGEETRETMGSWDTSEVPDGVYDIRLTVSDRLDNPGGEALQSERILEPLIVDNTSPKITGLKVRRVENGLRVEFNAEDERSALGAASIQLPSGRTRRLDPVDRICDSRREKFDATIAWPLPAEASGQEPWRIRIEVLDLSGNVGVAMGEPEGMSK